MNYPVWSLDFLGGGLLIAMMAVFHVYISHFAVGGGLFLVLTEEMGHRENNPAILEYVRKHAKFFLLLTMVAGSMTGVGIWFTIALLNPGATSVLIHNFVFGWAVEWVFFLIEIISLFIYVSTFDRLDRRTHLLMGWIYFGAAWMSLFIINGIIDFMLTPGRWLENHDFWSGFFNPTFWPAFFFRTFLALMLAGLFGFLTATWIKEPGLRLKMVRHCALYLLAPFFLLLAATWWYKAVLPAELQNLIFTEMPEMRPFISGFIRLSPVLVLGGLVMATRLPVMLKRPIAVIMLLTGFIYLGCFEFVREGGRRPYIIRDYMYSTAILKKDMARVRQNGLLKEAKWVRNREITTDNRLAAGREIFNILCLNCHSIGGPVNDISPIAANFIPSGLDGMIEGMDNTHPFMPPFAGNAEERAALAWFLTNGLHGSQDPTSATTPEIKVRQTIIPPFSSESDEFVLLAWSELGICSISDSFNYWMLRPPAAALHAQLIRRGETPEIVSEEVTITYRIEENFANQTDEVSLWRNVESLSGKTLQENPDPAGNGLSGNMRAEEGHFRSELVPVLPYPEQGGYNPYPRFTIEAKDGEGKLLAKTKVVMAVSTEMGCRNCHGGSWRVDGRTGFSRETAANILKTHDRLSGTNLLGRAGSGSPTHCQSCHADSGLKGKHGLLNLSAALHGYHANFLREEEAESCAYCHPSSPFGATRCLRGIHLQIGLDCTSCHGFLEDHALGLLKAEQEKGKERAGVLMSYLQPRQVDSVDKIVVREPWRNEPDCLTCHVDFQAPETDSAFNRWTASRTGLFRNRRDVSGQIFCAACHSSPHALYPAQNDYGENLDNIQPMQYQGNSLPIGSNMNCAVCHTMEMEDEMHHPNMLREFRN